jgi:hypothetical protein
MWVSVGNVETKEQLKQWMHIHSPNKPKNFINICQKVDGNCFLGQERTAVDGIRAIRVHNNVEVYCVTLEKLHWTIQNKTCGILTSSAVRLQDNMHSHTAAHNGALLEHFNREPSDHPPYSPDLALRTTTHLPS